MRGIAIDFLNLWVFPMKVKNSHVKAPWSLCRNCPTKMVFITLQQHLKWMVSYWKNARFPLNDSQINIFGVLAQGQNIMGIKTNQRRIFSNNNSISEFDFPKLDFLATTR